MTHDRIAEYRSKLLAVLARLDQMAADAELLRDDPADTGNVPLIEELCELLEDMRAQVEEKIDALVN